MKNEYYLVNHNNKWRLAVCKNLGYRTVTVRPEGSAGDITFAFVDKDCAQLLTKDRAIAIERARQKLLDRFGPGELLVA